MEGGSVNQSLEAPAAASSVSIQVLSSRPETVSQGDALVKVSLPPGAAKNGFKVMAAGRDLSASFRSQDAGTYIGLVTGLPVGSSTIEVSANNGNALKASVTVRNYDRNGPMFSGPHQSPWLCQTASFPLPDGTMLGPSEDASCNAPTKVIYVYRAKGGTAFTPLASTTSLPTDMDTTVTSDGKTVNHIVRLETGTLNRAVYQLAVLFDPTTEATPTPFANYKGWNRKLVFTFGGSAQAGYVQGVSTGGVLNDSMLSKGFAVVSSSLNVFGNNANDVLSAETASMVKEKFIETFGVPLYTMGWGPSGGSMQQHLIANNYPGILDGITPSASYPDLLSMVPPSTDCTLLDHAFKSGAQAWSEDQKTAVSGYGSWGVCASTTTTSWMRTFSPAWLKAERTSVPLLFGFLDLNNCMLALPAGWIYDPVSNPNGARCDLYSAVKNLIGIDPATGHAARGWDNVGVQYGLKAFRAGEVSGEQFVELNELAGGYDQDGNHQAARTEASALALNNMFQYGRVNEASNLADVPIIDFRPYLDLMGDIHDSVRSLITRARLQRANGSADNQVILRTTSTSVDDEVLTRMDEWLMNIINDARPYAEVAAKVVANKPAGLTDACYDATGARIVERADLNNGGQCGTLMPYHSNPRMVAGAPLTDDVLKCQLKPLSRSDYSALSDAQFQRLKAIFPSGVCDYTLPSVGSKPLKATWLSYPSPGVCLD